MPEKEKEIEQIRGESKPKSTPKPRANKRKSAGLPVEIEPTEKKENLHTGHRERLKTKFLTKGLEALEPHEILELLLFYAVPRQNTNEMAHRLIKRWGSLHQVLDAPHHDLMQEKGIKQNAATLLALISQLSRFYYESKDAEEKPLYDTTEKLGAYFMHKYIGVTLETVYLLSLDLSGKELSCGQVGVGGLSSAQINLRKIVEIAIQSRATHVVLAHNHPGGNVMPSNDDIVATVYLKNALATVDIVLWDHIIVSNRHYASLQQMGYLDT